MRIDVLRSVVMAALLLIPGMSGEAGTGFPGQKDQKDPAESGPKKRVESIPDHVVYEAFLRSLIELPETTEDGRAREKHRVETHAKEVGLSESGMPALLSAAKEFFSRISPLDREAHQAKWQVWLSPGRDLFVRLSDLQRDKIRIMDSVIYSLHAKLSNEDTVKLMQYIETGVKQKLIVLDLPDHIVLTDKSEIPAAGRGYGYCDTAIGWERGEVYGWCAVIEDYDVSALGYQITCTNAGPSGKPSSSAKSGQRPAPFGIVTATRLCVDGTCYDGAFRTNSSVMAIRIDQRSEKK